jgi:hypothetical protein
MDKGHAEEEEEEGEIERKRVQGLFYTEKGEIGMLNVSGRVRVRMRVYGVRD